MSKLCVLQVKTLNDIKMRIIVILLTNFSKIFPLTKKLLEFFREDILEKESQEKIKWNKSKNGEREKTKVYARKVA